MASSYGFTRSRKFCIIWGRRGVAQSGSARGLGPRGPRFKSGRPDLAGMV